MKLHEFTGKILDEYQAAGFPGETNPNGLPLIHHPESFKDKVRFLKFQPSLAVDRSIYLEGVLILPAGLAKELRA